VEDSSAPLDTQTALQILRDTEDDNVPQAVEIFVERELRVIVQSLEAAPDSYLLTKDEFALFNFYRHRYANEQFTESAISRFWSTHRNSVGDEDNNDNNNDDNDNDSDSDNDSDDDNDSDRMTSGGAVRGLQGPAAGSSGLINGARCHYHGDMVGNGLHQDSPLDENPVAQLIPSARSTEVNGIGRH
jgi:hypothetical protein